MDTKVCTKCGRELPLSEFYNDNSNKASRTGKTAACKICANKETKRKLEVKRGWCSVKFETKQYFKFCSVCGKIKSADNYLVNKQSGKLIAACKLCSYNKKVERRDIKACKILVKGKVYFKKCSICGIIKNVEDYDNLNTGLAGRKAKCKKCTLDTRREKSSKDVCRIKITEKVYFKRCSYCGKVLNLSKFDNQNNTSTGVRSWCKKCSKDIYHKRRENKIGYCNIDIKGIRYFKECSRCGKIKLINEFGKNNKEISGYRCECLQCRIEWERKNRLENKVTLNQKERIKNKIASEQLKDFYIRNLLRARGFKTEEIKPVLIEAKRAQVKLYRAINSVR